MRAAARAQSLRWAGWGWYIKLLKMEKNMKKPKASLGVAQGHGPNFAGWFSAHHPLGMVFGRSPHVFADTSKSKGRFFTWKETWVYLTSTSWPLENRDPHRLVPGQLETGHFWRISWRNRIVLCTFLDIKTEVALQHGVWVSIILMGRVKLFPTCLEFRPLTLRTFSTPVSTEPCRLSLQIGWENDGYLISQTFPFSKSQVARSVSFFSSNPTIFENIFVATLPAGFQG